MNKKKIFECIMGFSAGALLACEINTHGIIAGTLVTALFIGVIILIKSWKEGRFD